MAKLNSFLTSIADAIRSKKGTTEPINAQNFASEIASISGGSGGAVIKTIGGWQGTAVPESGLVDKVYFNTALTIEEFIELTQTLNFAFLDDMYISACVSDEAMQRAIAIMKQPAEVIGLPEDVYIIAAMGFDYEGYYCFQSQDVLGTGWVGWDPAFTGVVNVDMENMLSLIASYIGYTPENEKLNGIFSTTTPFIQAEGEKINLSGEYQEIKLEIVENGVTNIEENIVTNKEIPFNIKVNVPIPEGYIKPEGTINITENGKYEVKKYEKANVNFYIDYSIFDTILTNSNLTTYSNDRIYQVRDYLFYNYKTLETIDLPKVGNIGKSAFENCTALKNIPSFAFTYPNAFKGCTSLTTLNFPAERLNSIGESAFENCTGLTEVIVEKTNSYTMIGARAFKGCTNLKKVQITGDFTTRPGAFENCSSLVQPVFNGLTKLSSSVFRKCTALTEVYFPSVTSIDASTFEGCSELTSVKLPSCNTFYELNGAMYCFANCVKLNYVYTPNIPFIGKGMFQNCSSLVRSTFEVASEIYDEAFQNCSSLKELHLHYDGIVTLKNVSAFSGVPKGLSIIVRSEYADQYATSENWSTLINNGTVVIFSVNID